MKIIEKKCPNCGAGLEFSENDRTCRCEYCKRSFVIEQDKSIPINNAANRYRLNANRNKVLAIALISMFAPVFFPIIIFFFIFISIIFASIVAIPNAVHEQVTHSTIEKIEKSYDVEKTKEITSIDDLDDKIIERIKNNSRIYSKQLAKGKSDLQYSFQNCDSMNLEKIYFAYKEGTNSVITIYKTKYHNFWNQSDVQTVYIPMIYTNISNNSNLLYGKNTAPEYYFNEEKTTYIYAYSSFEEAYNNVVKPLENEYKISEK